MPDKRLFVSKVLMIAVFLLRIAISHVWAQQEPVEKGRADTGKVNSLLTQSDQCGCNDSLHKPGAASEALLLAEKIEWQRGIALANITLGKYYGECRLNFRKAANYFGTAAAAANSDIHLRATALEYLAQCYARLGEYGKAIYNYREMLNLPLDPEIKLGAFSNIGNIYASVYIYKTSLSYYDSALNVLKVLLETKKGNNILDSKALLKISCADIYMANHDYAQAIADYQAAADICTQTNNKYGIILSLTDLGKAYQAQGNDEKVIAYYDKVLEKCKATGTDAEDKNSELAVYNQLARLYAKQGANKRAMSYALRSLALIADCPGNAQAPVTYNILGEIYARQGEYKQAVACFENAVSLSQISGTLEEERDALNAMSALYQKTGQPARSLEAYKRYIAVRDSIYNVDKVKEITRYELTADFKEQKAVMVADQDKKSAIMLLTIKKQRLAYIAFSIIILLILIVGGLVFSRFRLRRKLEMQLAIAGERTRISSEMHDDLGAQLSKISLLSDLVKREAGDQASLLHLENISRSSRESLDKLGEIVWSLSDKYDTIESLVLYIRRYAMEYFAGTAIDCKITMPDEFPDIAIEGDVRRSIFLIVKEALHNVLKHSGGDLVSVAIDIRDRSIHITIQDNGADATDAKASKLGNGLHNMTRRTEDLNGTFAKRYQNGTLIELAFPIPV